MPNLSVLSLCTVVLWFKYCRWISKCLISSKPTRMKLLVALLIVQNALYCVSGPIWPQGKFILLHGVHTPDNNNVTHTSRCSESNGALCCSNSYITNKNNLKGLETILKLYLMDIIHQAFQFLIALSFCLRTGWKFFVRCIVDSCFFISVCYQVEILVNPWWKLPMIVWWVEIYEQCSLI